MDPSMDAQIQNQIMVWKKKLKTTNQYGSCGMTLE